jgi:RNA recognition motif-containing protein
MKNVYVGNLNLNTTEEQLRTSFETYGQVEKVNIIRDQDSGLARGFAFVEMANDSEGEKAIAGLNGSSLEGNALNVNEARAKTPRAKSGRSRS